MAARIAILVDATMVTDAGITPSLVREGEPGHYPTTWNWGTDLAAAKHMAEEQNAAMGLTPQDVTAIIASSMFA